MNGVVTKDFSSNIEFLKDAKQLYKEFDGNFGDISNVRKYEDLPAAAREFIEYIEDYTGTVVKLIGVGADRECIISR